tara:strand:+ start:1446 stop:1868 length:423 start_codon:yes stop_codon:yes gene_type:complete
MNKKVIGWREKVTLLDFDKTIVKAKMDSGARTSSLHATHIKEFERNGITYVNFRIKVGNGSERKFKHVIAKLKEWRKVRNSSGETEFRPVIKTKILIGKHKINTELTLTQRSKMTYDMLIGRIAIKKKFIIDAGRSYIVG